MKGGKARKRFLDKQRRNQIIAQLNELYAAGYTTDDVRGAGKNAYRTLGGGGASTNYTIADGDTVSTIAQANGIAETDLLAANPDLKKISTGMVVSVPGSPAWRAQNTNQAGGIGLPSNAAFGGLTNNPQGNNPFRSEKQQSPGDIYLAGIEASRRGQQKAVINFLTRDTPYRGYGPNAPRGEHRRYPLYADNTAAPNISPTYPLYAGNYVPPRNNPYPLYAQSVIAAQQNRPQPTTPRPATAAPGINAAMPNSYINYSMLEENYHIKTLDRVLNSNNYTQADINYLEKIGMLKRAPARPAYLSSPRYTGGRGGGRRRSGGTNTTTYAQPRPPAFSTQGAFRGLVSWRL